jgi:hypothetical protein
VTVNKASSCQWINFHPVDSVEKVDTGCFSIVCKVNPVDSVPGYWDTFWQVVSQDCVSSSKWQWTESFRVSLISSSHWIQLGHAASRYYASSYQLIQFQHVEYFLTSCIPILCVLHQVKVKSFRSCQYTQLHPMDSVGRSFNWMLCKVIPFDSVSGCGWCWDTLYKEMIWTIGNDSKHNPFLAVYSFPAIGSSRDMLHHAIMQVHTSLFSSITWSRFWLVVSLD